MNLLKQQWPEETNLDVQCVETRDGGIQPLERMLTFNQFTQTSS